MKVKTWIPLVLAVVMGLAAAKLVSDSLSRNQGPADDTKYVATVTAARDIEPGQKLTPADLTTGKTPSESQPIGSFSAPTELADRVAATRIVKGQTVLDSLLAPTGTAAGVQALIPTGLRAVTVQVDEFSGLGGLLIPGCKVDIIAIVRSEGDATNVARTIVQNVEVRAVGRLISSAAAQANATAAGEATPGAPAVPIPTSVTLLVTPEQAEAVQLASVGGKPWLVLRNATDAEPFDSEGVTMADLRGEKSDKPNPIENQPTKLAVDPFAETPKHDTKSVLPEVPKTRTVKFIRATKEEAMQIDLPPAPPGDFLTHTDPSSATK